MSLANAFKSFTELVTGKKSDTTAAYKLLQMRRIMLRRVSGTGAAAKKAAKDIKGMSTVLMNECHKSGYWIRQRWWCGGAGGYAADEFDMGEMDTSGVEEASNKYQALIDRTRELKDLFKTGFSIGFGGHISH